MPQVFTDVLVLGSGIAGQAAALRASERGVRVMVLTKSGPMESNTLYAQAGIAAVIGGDDSIAQHRDDTLAAGDGLCDQAVVQSVVEDGPDAVRWLVDLGVDFDRDERNGPLVLGREGGHSSRRVAHARGDATGSEIQEALARRLTADRRIKLHADAFVVDLLTDDDRCVGALVLIRGEVRVVWAGSVVLATGGAARLFRESTNPGVTTGDGIAMAHRAGVRLRDMEFMQFHPTVLYVPGAKRMLISEAARGEGALITDTAGDRFLTREDPRGELAPRDVVARGIVKHLLEHGGTHVLLDLTVIDPQRLLSRLPGVVASGTRVGIDVFTQPLPVRPAAHYTIGGLVTDLDGQTSLSGLFAAGEVASTGLHGANRLASNSLLEGAVCGRRAGFAAAESMHGRSRRRDLSGEGPGPAAAGLDVQDIVRTVKSLVWRHAGVRRSGAVLRDARDELAGWAPHVLGSTLSGGAGMEAQNLCLLADLVIEAALLREETRGVHWREDHPTRDDERFRAHVMQQRDQATRLIPLDEEVGLG